MIELTGATSSIRFQPLPQDDPRRRRPVIDRARALLRWQPRVPLEVGPEAHHRRLPRPGLAPAPAIRVPALVARTLTPERRQRDAALPRVL